MGLTAGIVGLPNVGKSTLFNAITKKNILAANYPFATIDPNVGVVTVPDKRLETLDEMYKPERVIATQYEFIDIAGLVKGASTGEGLGNKFLANIREVDAIVQVVRCFENKDIIHVEGNIDPTRDIEIVNYELILSDSHVLAASSLLITDTESYIVVKFLIFPLTFSIVLVKVCSAEFSPHFGQKNPDPTTSYLKWQKGHSIFCCILSSAFAGKSTKYVLLPL